jgi:hypothetical protein
MRKAGLALPATCFISLCSAQAPREQGWIPQRRVGMDYPRLACKARIRGQVEVICELPDGRPKYPTCGHVKIPHP